MKSNDTKALHAANSIIDYLSEDIGAFGDGRRNDDCVDICIAYHVLGTSHENILPKVIGCHKRLYNRPTGHAAITVRNKINDIVGYLDTWGPEGKEENALNYLCRPIEYYEK